MPPHSFDLSVGRLYEEAYMARETTTIIKHQEVKLFVWIVALPRFEFDEEG